MTNGYWGGRFPVGNLLVSKLIFWSVRWRVASRRVINNIKRLRRTHHVHLVNDVNTKAQLTAWLNQGYSKLNIGGGRKNLAGFVNLDFVDFPEVQRGVVANILDLSFVPSGCASQIHSNHVVEHLSPSQLDNQLAEYKRILRANGLLTIRCPNALGAAYGFWFEPVIESDRDAFVQLGFPPDENLSDKADRWVYHDFYALMHWFYGDVGNIENQHLNILTPTKIKLAVENTGFTVIKMAEPESVNIVLIARRS